jgi:predicted aminopeptidase
MRLSLGHGGASARAARHRGQRALLLLAFLPVLAGCSSLDGLGYYAQAVRGHLGLLAEARPIDDWLSDPASSEALRDRLRLARAMRAFAVDALALPDNASYHRYADLRRPYAVWNVVAAPADALTLKTWCFPVAGCVGYRGYFAEADARAEAALLAREGWEVDVYGVPAYSTLGRLNWIGGDPLLSTFALGHEGDLARLMFHELAHQVLYVEGDTEFNESFASAVERAGVALWLDRHGNEVTRASWARTLRQREAFAALTRATRQALAAVYEQNRPDAGVNRSMIAIKTEVMARFRADYEALKRGWPEPDARWNGYDAWVAKANNASFGALGAYDALRPGFEALLARAGGGVTPAQWRSFYDAVRRLAALPPGERHAALEALAATAKER